MSICKDADELGVGSCLRFPHPVPFSAAPDKLYYYLISRFLLPLFPADKDLNHFGLVEAAWNLSKH